LVLRALKKAISIDPDHHEVHQHKITFLHTVQQQMSTLHPTVQAVITSEKGSLIGEKATLKEVNDSYLTLHKLSLPRRTAAAEVMCLLDPTSKQEAKKLVSNLDNVKGYKLMEECMQVYKTIGDVFSDKNAAEEYPLKCRVHFPLATIFLSENEKGELANKKFQEKQKKKKRKKRKRNRTTKKKKANQSILQNEYSMR